MLAVSPMTDALRRRGPDDSGTWVDATDGVAFGHRRLSVIDLSAEGHQPMASPTGRYNIVFNGEIYNHLELRAALIDQGGNVSWRGHSDTETLLAAFETWGVEETLKKSVGMFALAVWDKQKKLLKLARDRLGEKPLYFGWQGETLLFGSELKALAAHPDWDGRIDRSALTLFVRYGYVPTPHSIWLNIQKLTPGSVLTLRPEDSPGSQYRIEGFWNELSAANVDPDRDMDDNSAANKLDELLRRAIRGQMISDVPLGAFLSGGVDSSTVVALMQAQSTSPVKTFSIGFDNEEYNEARYAKVVSKHLGTDHTELYVTPEDAMRVIPDLPDIYDEPFADSSQIPTHLVSSIARKEVTVSLSGDGGDELFGGYNRYVLGSMIWNGIRWLPLFARRQLQSGIASISPHHWDSVGKLAPKRFRQPMIGDRAHKFASILSAQKPEDIYTWLVSHERSPTSLVRDGQENEMWSDRLMPNLRRSDFRDRMMFNDMVSYLPDDILCKVDRAAMAISLETRVPFLDHRVVEFAWRLPMHMKIRDGQGKWLLRQVLYRYVPKQLIERSKQGFGVPIGDWLRGPLRDWAEQLLNKEWLRTEGFFDPELIHLKWQEHLSNKKNWEHWLWSILMFQAWNERWRNKSAEIGNV